MMKSMTAFGRGECENELKRITVEIKSVNSRFFDCNIKLPRAYSSLEDRVRSYVQRNAVSRARVEVFVSSENLAESANTVEIDYGFAESYISALRALGDKFSLKDDISIMSVARNQELFRVEKREADAEEDWKLIKEALDLAFVGYGNMRCAEGERISFDVKEKIKLISSYADEVEKISLTDSVGYRDKLEAKIRSILQDNSIEIDENRLLTECAVWADKIAIDEELVRLRSHFKAFHEIADLPEPSGRKLDFLVQELNRETNTIGSKANNAKIARYVVDMKGEIEKIREQVQNIE